MPPLWRYLFRLCNSRLALESIGGQGSRHRRVPTRWLLRYLEEHPETTIEQAAVAASCLTALPGANYREAAQTLRAMAETATSRRQGRA
jgi:hypothetical protein